MNIQKTKGSVQKGAAQAVNNCIKVRPGEKVVIITDEKTKAIGAAIKKECEKITENIVVFIMEDFGKRPLAFPETIENAMKNADVSFYAAGAAPGELQTFRMPMIKCVDENKKLRHAHMIGITTEIMKDGMCSDYREVQKVSRLVYEKVKSAKAIRVTARGGSDFTGKFSPKFRWVISDGNITARCWSNLPTGEDFTCPKDVNGVAVIDGCLGDYFKKYGLLDINPVTVEIKNGRAVKESVRCKDKIIEADFIKYLFETDENSDRVGEFAIGTNVGLADLIGNLLQDEKFPGVHIAFGSPYPHKTGAKWDSRGHLDGVIRSTNIYVDGKIIMKDGKFLI